MAVSPQARVAPRNQVLVLVGAINPATGLPYTHDNRVVGHPASEIPSPGIGAFVDRLVRLRCVSEDRRGGADCH